jgi:plasmid maintenance system antidote protein VapI
MSKPEYLDQLLQHASDKAGSDYRLAQVLEVNRATISQWRSGKRTCPPGDVALMAEMLGLDPEAWTARAVIAQHEGTQKGVRLASALKKAVLVTGAALATSGANAAADGVSYFIRCIAWLIKGQRSPKAV